MKIAIFTDMYLDVAGGIPSSLKAQKSALESAGFKVVVFCPSWRPVKDPTIFTVPTCPNLKPGNAPLARNPELIEDYILKHYVNFSSFDLIHVHYEAGCSIAGVRLARRFKLPLVQTMHGREDMAVTYNIPFFLKTFVSASLNLFHSWYLPHKTKIKRDSNLAPTIARAKMWTLMVNHANFADLVLTPSEHFKKKLKSYGVKKPLKTLSNGIEDSLIPSPIKTRALSVGEPLKLLWNSRVSHEKRILPFLYALSLVDFPFIFHIFGDGNDYKKAKRFVKRTHFSGEIIFHGVAPRKTIFSEMLTMHLGIMASYHFDTQGMTLLEAQAVGLPVFFCDPDMKEVVPNGSSICAKGPSPKDMALALKDLYKNPEKIAKMSKIMVENRKDVLQSEKIKELIRIYESFS